MRITGPRFNLGNIASKLVIENIPFRTNILPDNKVEIWVELSPEQHEIMANFIKAYSMEESWSITDEKSDPACPACVFPAEQIGSAFVEHGEWDGRQYEGEYDVKRFECTNSKCKKVFFI
ncbi:hypothetical protein ACFQZE_23890 [Paenibacillus sp. GCM10027627]|uniref:hypothetical protein n=1 Tax=unclassified Paenibacillus TaxID=185978 RepID=UPI003631D350